MQALTRPGGRLAAFVGTPREVRSWLEHSTAEQVIVLSVKRTDARHAQLLAQTLVSVIPFIDRVLHEHDEQTLKALVNALVPKAPPAPTWLQDAAMLARSRRAVSATDRTTRHENSAEQPRRSR